MIFIFIIKRGVFELKNQRGDLRILACNSGRFFAQKVIEEINENSGENGLLIASEEMHFANGELKTVINESIRGNDVYIFQDVASGEDININLRALKTAIDAAWRSDAGHITAVIPTFPFARQDKAHDREGITAASVAREIENCHADHIITLDIHNTAIVGFFRKARVDNLHASKNIMDFIKKSKLIDTKNLVVMPPDLGRARLAEHYAQKLGTEMAFIYKKRNYKIANTVDKSEVIGDVADKDVLIVDDMIDTGGTLVKAMEAVKEAGAKNVFASCSLPFFNGSAIERFDKLFSKGIMKGVIGTDAVYHKNLDKKWFHEVSVASYFAKVISCLNNNMSISGLLK